MKKKTEKSSVIFLTDRKPIWLYKKRLIVFWLFLCVSPQLFAQDSHVSNFSSWQIDDSNLVNGNLSLPTGMAKTVHFSVTVVRNVDGNGDYDMESPIHFNFELEDENGAPLTNTATITQLNFEDDATSATIKYSIDLAGAGSGAPTDVAKLKSGDKIRLAVNDKSFDGEWVLVNKYYSVTVSEASTPPFPLPDDMGTNIICCDQCVLKGMNPEPFIQDPEVTLDGQYTFQWMSDHPIDGATSSSYTPVIDPSEDQIKGYYRVAKNISTGKSYSSNLLTIRISSTFKTYTTAGANYSSNTVKEAYDIHVSGNQIPSSSTTVDFKAGRQINISPLAKLLPGIHLSISKWVTPCTWLGRLKTDGIGTQPLAEITRLDNETSNDLVVYPNPSLGDAIIKYRIATKGTVSLFITDIYGRVVSILINDENVEYGYHNYQFNSDKLSSGIYLCVLTDGKQKTVKHFSILK